MRTLAKTVFLTLILSVATAACADDTGSTNPTRAAPTASPTQAAPTASPTPAAINVVTTTNFVADWVRNVGGGNVEVFSLVPLGADPHSFQPGARDVSRIADADVVLSVGLGLEAGWLDELLDNAASDPSIIVEMGRVIDPIDFVDTQAHDEDEDGDGHDEDGDGDGHDEDEDGDGHDEDGDGDGHDEDGDEEAHDEDGDGEAHDEDGDGDGHDEDGDGDGHDEDGDGDGHDEDGDEEAHDEDGDEEAHDEDEDGDGHDEDGDEEAHDEDEDGDGHDEDGDGDGEAHDEDEHGHSLDPHFWFDPLRVKRVVNDVAARLAVLDPERGDTYRANAAAYSRQLDELHAWTQLQVSAVRDGRRVLVTSHDSLGYFAQLYGFQVVGTILPVTAAGEVSAEHMADLVKEIEEYGVPAIFGETTVSERLASALANETGAKLVRLYSGSLGAEGSGAETYLDMVRTNVERIVEALK